MIKSVQEDSSVLVTLTLSITTVFLFNAVELPLASFSSRNVKNFYFKGLKLLRGVFSETEGLGSFYLRIYRYTVFHYFLNIYAFII